VLAIAPGQLTFAATIVGQKSATQVATVTNNGLSNIPDLLLAASAGYWLDPTATTCTTALAAGASCKAGVLLLPTAVGTVNGTLTASSASASTNHTTAASITLSGSGALAPGIVTSPAAQVQFGTTGVGQAATPVAVTVTNQGTQTALTGLTLQIDGTGTTDGFGLANNTCGVTLAANSSCTVNVTLTPTLAGKLTGNLLLASSNGNSWTVALSGVAFNFQIGVLSGLTNGTLTVVRGQTGYVTLDVLPLGGSGSVGPFSFQCTGLPTNSVCVFNPAQLGALPPSVTGNVTMGISTTAPTVLGQVRPLGKSPGGSWPEKGLLICAVVMAPLAWWRRKFGGALSAGKGARVAGLMMVLAAAGVVCLMNGCAGAGVTGGSSSGGGSGGQTNLGGGTTPGTYVVQVTATAGGVSHTLPKAITFVVN
jgi:hypothetical protein